MKSKVFYVTPELNKLELDLEGIICSSDRNGNIDPLDQAHDWSDYFNK